MNFGGLHFIDHPVFKEEKEEAQPPLRNRASAMDIFLAYRRNYQKLSPSRLKPTSDPMNRLIYYTDTANKIKLLQCAARVLTHDLTLV